MYKTSEILKEVRRLQKEYPNCVYNQDTCSYSKGSCKKGPKTKGCIIGQAIRNVYPDLFELIKRDDDTNSIESIISSKNYEITGSKRDIGRLEDVQNRQDQAFEWGIC